MTILSEFLFTKRQQRGLTSNELAAKTGLTPLAISKIESGEQQPTLTELVTIAVALDLNHGQVRGHYGRLVENLAHEAYNETLRSMGILKSVEVLKGMETDAK